MTELTNGEIAAQQWVEQSSQDETDRYNTFLERFSIKRMVEPPLTTEVAE